ncbi:glucosaminidase domain-containing protein [Streptococcus didelphis]|uniref:Glucosaminidase domain-containing protein n=1 Tax=Streptococcus didelphis TaxID=102886 RepID=A0ABY9LHP7_9STRE|nr:glucosaminidase domain-containing protein [Streptococcus didelphis]WMB28330.1 glucosaminidase domain-containing protein [Streptococcus didelphis]WMB29009.1 glucosaminidase domain-containing protein [Streptococcus didelphis]
MKKKNYKKKYRSKKKGLDFSSWIVIYLLLVISYSLFSLSKEKEELKIYSGTETMTFMSKVASTANHVAKKKDLYTSIMLAQAILESNNGKSKLSQKPYYNFFGIKGDYKGKSVILPTLEDDGQGNLYQIDARFRSYNKLSYSFEDYARVLEDPLYLKTHQSKTKNYEEATATLRGVYATDSAYNDKLNQLISSYHLYNFDYSF